MSSLQAEHRRNVVSTLVKGRPMRRRNPDHAEYWEFSRAGSATGSCGRIHSNWVENRASFTFSGPLLRHHVVLELCGMDCSISVQTEYVVFRSDQFVSARRFEQDKSGVPATCKNELAVTSDGV